MSILEQELGSKMFKTYIFVIRSVPCLQFHINLATDRLMDTLYKKEETNTPWGTMQPHTLR
jgi:hypothetical protein